MLSHEKVWAAIDELASKNGLSPSGLARRAGLDPTTFNRSKRIAVDGRPRWPSTESLAKALEATGEGLKSFAARVEVREQLPATGAFKETNPLSILNTGEQLDLIEWDKLRFPQRRSSNEFALRICGSGLLPLYRDGDVIIAEADAAIRVNDRLLIQQSGAPMSIYTFLKRFPEHLQLRTIGDNPKSMSIEHSAIEWTARIIWASQ